MTLKLVFTVVLLLAASGCSLTASTTTAPKTVDGTYYGRTLPFSVF